MYALFDDAAQQLTFERVPYDRGGSGRHPRHTDAALLCRPAGAGPMKALEPGVEVDGFVVGDDAQGRHGP
jgi:hypothetical protein